MQDYLNDKEFLKELDYSQEKTTFVRIISLTNDELPIQEIIGKATGGSVNVDGASAVRRTCNLSLTTVETDPIITDAYWCYNTKFKLQIGLENRINLKYPDIIWFDMGIYVITSFSKSKSTSNFNISISGQDKMCRLNGTVSGNIMMSTDFGVLETNTRVWEIDPETGEEYETYTTTLEKLEIYKIIQNALKEYAQEKPENIIINDLEEYGYELWEYYGDEPMYMIIQDNENEGQKIINMLFNGDTEINGVALKDFETSGYKFYSLNTLDSDYNNDATPIKFGTIENCRVAQIQYGETAGYHRIPLVYNTDLILNAGDTVTSLLDKLKGMLGNFEYFYDLQGRFIFQRKNTYQQELFSPLGNTGAITPTMIANKYEYKFEDEALFKSISNNPNINNIKNDFAVWGSSADANLPFHIRYAVDKKPTQYHSPWERYERQWDYTFIEWDVDEEPSEEDTATKYYIAVYDGQIFDGFEYVGIYKDYIKSLESGDDPAPVYTVKETAYGASNELILPTEKANAKLLVKQQGLDYQYAELSSIDNVFYIKNEQGEGYSKYMVPTDDDTAMINLNKLYKHYSEEDLTFSIEKYDWRELIYQMALDFYQHNQDVDFLNKIKEKNPWTKEGRTGYEQYYSDLQGFWRQLYNPMERDSDRLIADIQKFEYYTDGSDKYWNKAIHLNPNSLKFWFDFLDIGGTLGNYSVDKIGTRSKVVNDNAVKSIYYKETPEVLFVVMPQENVEGLEKTAYTPIWIQDNMQTLFYRSTQGLDAITKVNELLQQHLMSSESISITSIPIYYLQPNTRIYVQGQGDFTLDKISYQLSYNGTMNLSCNKIIKQFI